MKITKHLVKYQDYELKNILECKDDNVNEGAFTRERKMTFKDIISIILGRKGLTSRMELFDFYKKAEKKAVSKQDYSKQRMKIKEKFWIDANNAIVKQFYDELKYNKLNEYIVIAIDGSKTILPRVKELEEKYGLANANNSQQKCVQCLISGCYDVLNNIMLNIEIEPYASDEREVSKKNIMQLKKVFPNKKFLIIFDRGYPSIDMIYFLEKNNLKYLIRLQSSTYENEKRNMKSNDEMVEIKLSGDRLTGKMSDETREELKKLKKLKTRFVKCELSTNQAEWLTTNLEQEMYSDDMLKDLYFKRWEIEKAYDNLKNKLQIENISGKKDHIVKQDIRATIIIYNMIEAANFILKDEIINDENNKYQYKINTNILIGAFKNLFIDFVITESPKKKEQLMGLLQEFAIKSKIAIMENRSYKREFKSGNLKCKTNMKRSF